MHVSVWYENKNTLNNVLGINCECFSIQGKSDVRLVQRTKRFALYDLIT